MPRKKRVAENMSTQQDKRMSDFAKHSVQAALRVAAALEDKNGGNSMPPLDVALALGISPGSSNLRDLLSSSIKYGLTSGSFNQPRVALEALGRDIVQPKSVEDKHRALFEAAFKPNAFRRVWEAYRGKKLPDPAFFRNALMRDFGVPREMVANFAEVFLSNIGFLGLIKDAPNGKWLSNDHSSPKAPFLAEEEGGQVGNGAAAEVIEDSDTDVLIPGERSTQAGLVQKQAIFVGHGKNKAPLQQLERILNEYHIPHKIAVYEANEGRPISQKVADIMNQCGSAIIIFTADEEFKDRTGNAIYRPSENAVFELGAASVMYGRRVVIFREESVSFPANFRDIGHIPFEKDNLAAKTNELFRELISFGLIRITVGS